MISFAYSRADDVADAVRQIAADPEARFIAGGTNLIDLMKENVARPSRLIEITRLPLDPVRGSQKPHAAQLVGPTDARQFAQKGLHFLNRPLIVRVVQAQERLLHRDLLVERKADEQGHGVRGDERIGLVGVCEIEAVGHGGAIIDPRGSLGCSLACRP